LDFRPLLHSVISDRRRGRDLCEIAYAFHGGIARGLYDALITICKVEDIPTVVLSGGVFQNELLQEYLKELLKNEKLEIWTNHAVPPNDGGISLGQAAIAGFSVLNRSN
jgi:hydrogenase maturation protein HypF